MNRSLGSLCRWWAIAKSNTEIPVDKEAIPLFVDEDIANTDITMQYFSFKVGSVVSYGVEMNILILEFGIVAKKHIPVMA